MEQPDNHCQIYLIIPANVERAHLDLVLSSDAFDTVSCVLLRTDAGHVDHECARALLAATQKADIPLLLENAAKAAKQLGADGAHADGGEDDVAGARDMLGDDLIVGATCGLTRHSAMSLSESGADYIAFLGDDPDALEDLVAWWSDVTVIPCIGWDVKDIALAQRLAEAGADFVSFDTYVWQHRDGPVAALREIASALSPDKAAA